ncbi:MAG: glucosyl-3-phosphoglycerate synthase [Actinomycetota bacterium]|nr:glucosyl-3-phosphoglycerate synthase [Actinomycetota bacterium]
MRPDVRRWFDRRTSLATDWPVDRLLEHKGACTVSVVLPALDEAATIGRIVETIRRELVDTVPLVDELVVLDSGSTDATAAVALAAGASVVAGAELLPHLGSVAGKGEALWKSLFATTGDLVVFVDADLAEFGSHVVTGLLGPLLCDPATAFVKAAYDRPLGAAATGGGGRVTELVARPLLNLYWPELAGFVQPLAGEYAGRRSALEAVPFVSGYGVELALLVDLLERVGLDGLAQVDLGRRVHRNRPDAALAPMASAIWQTALGRLERTGRLVSTDEPSSALTGFGRDAGGWWAPETVDVGVSERPPMLSVAEYAARRARAS